MLHPALHQVFLLFSSVNLFRKKKKEAVLVDGKQLLPPVDYVAYIWLSPKVYNHSVSMFVCEQRSPCGRHL